MLDKTQADVCGYSGQNKEINGLINSQKPSGANIAQVRLERRQERGFVYFIGADDAIKIGWSVYPPTRMNDLQCANQATLVMVATFPGTRSDEHSLHLHFRHLRVRGEWFRRDPELLAFIADLEDARTEFGFDAATIRNAVGGTIERMREVAATMTAQRAFLAWYEAKRGNFANKAIEDQAGWCAHYAKTWLMNKDRMPAVLVRRARELFTQLDLLMATAP